MFSLTVKFLCTSVISITFIKMPDLYPIIIPPSPATGHKSLMTSTNLCVNSSAINDRYTFKHIVIYLNLCCVIFLFNNKSWIIFWPTHAARQVKTSDCHLRRMQMRQHLALSMKSVNVCFATPHRQQFISVTCDQLCSSKNKTNTRAYVWVCVCGRKMGKWIMMKAAITTFVISKVNMCIHYTYICMCVFV